MGAWTTVVRQSLHNGSRDPMAACYWPGGGMDRSPASGDLARRASCFTLVGGAI